MALDLDAMEKQAKRFAKGSPQLAPGALARDVLALAEEVRRLRAVAEAADKLQRTVRALNPGRSLDDPRPPIANASERLDLALAALSREPAEEAAG